MMEKTNEKNECEGAKSSDFSETAKSKQGSDGNIESHSVLFDFCTPRKEKAISDGNIESHGVLFEFCTPRKEKDISDSSTVKTETTDTAEKLTASLSPTKSESSRVQETSDLVESCESKKLLEKSSSKQLEFPTTSKSSDLSVKPKYFGKVREEKYSEELGKPKNSKSTKFSAKATSNLEISEAKSSKTSLKSNVAKFFTRVKSLNKSDKYEVSKNRDTYEEFVKQGRGIFRFSESQLPESSVQSQESESESSKGYESIMQSQGSESLIQSHLVRSPSESRFSESPAPSQLFYSASESQLSESSAKYKSPKPFVKTKHSKSKLRSKSKLFKSSISKYSASSEESPIQTEKPVSDSCRSVPNTILNRSMTSRRPFMFVLYRHLMYLKTFIYGLDKHPYTKKTLPDSFFYRLVKDDWKSLHFKWDALKKHLNVLVEKLQAFYMKLSFDMVCMTFREFQSLLKYFIRVKNIFYDLIVLSRMAFPKYRRFCNHLDDYLFIMRVAELTPDNIFPISLLEKLQREIQELRGIEDTVLRSLYWN